MALNPNENITTGSVLRTMAVGADVRNFGAVGDGVADDTSAIQAAINSGAGVVYLPAGTYKTTAAIILRSGLELRGDGDAVTIIKATSSTQNALQGVALIRVKFTNFQLQGPNNGSPTNGISITKGAAFNVPYIDVKELTVTGFGNDGISIEQIIVSSFDRVTVQSVGRYGFNIYGQAGGAAGTSVSMTACFANAAGVAGYRIFKMSYCSLNACAADNSVVGYLLDDCFNVSLVGCGGESNTSNTVKVNAGYGNSINSHFFYDNRGVACWITGSAKAVVLQQCIDVAPNASATNFVKVDAGCRVAMVACNATSANSLAASTTSTLMDSNGNFLMNTSSLGGGNGVLAIANASASPTSNPSGGGILYVEGGAIKWRGSNGTVTTIANA